MPGPSFSFWLTSLFATSSISISAAAIQRINCQLKVTSARLPSFRLLLAIAARSTITGDAGQVHISHSSAIRRLASGPFGLLGRWFHILAHPHRPKSARRGDRYDLVPLPLTTMALAIAGKVFGPYHQPAAAVHEASHIAWWRRGKKA
jgi:hypothetical protein